MATASIRHVRNSNTAVDINLLNKREKDRIGTLKSGFKGCRSRIKNVDSWSLSLANGFGQVNLSFLCAQFRIGWSPQVCFTIVFW